MTNKQIARAKKIIENDRLGLVFGTEDLIKHDIESLLLEYFNLTMPVKITLNKKGDKIQITITTECQSVKRLSLIHI